jgi:hypothetical protein
MYIDIRMINHGNLLMPERPLGLRPLVQSIRKLSDFRKVIALTIVARARGLLGEAPKATGF